MACLACDSLKIVAKGYCSGCYSRLRRRGTLQRAYVQKKPFCTIDGCGAISFAKNLCLGHYRQQLHPLRNTWKLIRSRHPGEFPESWERFDAFLSEIGERPDEKAQLRRSDITKPWSKDNVRWAMPVKTKDCYDPMTRAEYSREWNLRKRFKITGAERAAMLAAQGGGCAICGVQDGYETIAGDRISLAVDHCHASGVNRGLLCSAHNSGLGLFKDDPALLRAAADYLEKWQWKHQSMLTCTSIAAE